MDWRSIEFEDEGVVEELSECEELLEEYEKGEDLRFDWGFEENEQIFDIKNLRFKPFTTSIKIKQKYHDAVALTGILYTHQFTRFLRRKIFRITYYDKPYGEYHVQAKFFDDIDTVELIDVEANYDLIYHLVSNVEVLSRLKKIMLRKCNLRPDLLTILCPKLDEAYLLSELDLSHNPLGDEGMRIIIKYLYYWTFMKHLCLFDTGLTSLSADRLGTLYLKQRVYLTRLDLGRNNFSNPKSVKKFLNGICKRAPIEELLMPNCSLKSEETAGYFLTYMRVAPRIKFLDLSYNMFTSAEAAVALATMFVESGTLIELVLNFNTFGEKAIQEMLNVVLDSPARDQYKVLLLENFSLSEEYFKQKFVSYNRLDIKVKICGVRRVKMPPTDSFKVRLAKRVNFLFFKRKRKPKKDLVVATLLEDLKDLKLSRIRSDRFAEALALVPRLDEPLIKEIVTEYTGRRNRCDVQKFIDLYKELFPEKPKTQKKGKKKKKKKKK